MKPLSVPFRIRYSVLGTPLVSTFLSTNQGHIYQKHCEPKLIGRPSPPVFSTINVAHDLSRSHGDEECLNHISYHEHGSRFSARSFSFLHLHKMGTIRKAYGFLYYFCRDDMQLYLFFQPDDPSVSF